MPYIILDADGQHIKDGFRNRREALIWIDCRDDTVDTTGWHLALDEICAEPHSALGWIC